MITQEYPEITIPATLNVREEENVYLHPQIPYYTPLKQHLTQLTKYFSTLPPQPTDNVIDLAWHSNLHILAIAHAQHTVFVMDIVHNGTSPTLTLRILHSTCIS
jgi:hypothetical protein